MINCGGVKGSALGTVRGPPKPLRVPRTGRGLARRSTATSCRSTTNSTSLVDVVRPSSKTSLRTCWKIRYNSRSDTAAIMPDRWSPLVSSVCHVLEPHSHPRITLHFTPTSGSWLNMVEIFFGIITRQAIRRGSFDSVRELVDAIRRFIDGWNERCEPFIWTKDPDTILAKAQRKKTSDT